MARNDIRAPLAHSGGSHRLTALPMAAGATFSMGEPVVWDGAGGIQEAADDPATIAGIAAVDATPAQMAAVATTPNFIGRYLTRAAGTLCQVYEVDQDQWFVCPLFAIDGAGTPVTPTQANAIGQRAGLNLNLTSDRWSVDTGSANLICVIEGVIDNRHNSITDPHVLNTAGTAVVFRFDF